MNRLIRLTLALVVASLLATPALHAAPATFSSPVHAMFSKTKMVRLSLRNDSGSPMDIKIDDKVMTLAPGKPLELNLPVGTRILAASATSTHEAGALIEEVIKEHSGSTIIVR